MDPNVRNYILLLLEQFKKVLDKELDKIFDLLKAACINSPNTSSYITPSSSSAPSPTLLDLKEHESVPVVHANGDSDYNTGADELLIAFDDYTSSTLSVPTKQNGNNTSSYSVDLLDSCDFPTSVSTTTTSMMMNGILSMDEPLSVGNGIEAIGNDSKDLKLQSFNLQSFLNCLTYDKSNIKAIYEVINVIEGLKMPYLKIDEKYTAVCAFPFTIHKFICIILSNQNKSFNLEIFTDKLTFYYNNKYQKLVAPLDLLVAFCYKDFFFRGYVMRKLGNNFQVLAVDFGFITYLTEENLFPLVEEFSFENYAPFVCICSLNNVLPPTKTWSTECLHVFRNFFANQKEPFTLTPRLFLKFTKCMFSVDIKFDHQGASLSEQLIRKTHALAMI